MARTKLVPKRAVKIRRWPPRQPYTKFKIKTLIPEQKTVQIKKNGQGIRAITTRRKTKKIYGPLGKNILMNDIAKYLKQFNVVYIKENLTLPRSCEYYLHFNVNLPYPEKELKNCLVNQQRCLGLKRKKQGSTYKNQKVAEEKEHTP